MFPGGRGFVPAGAEGEAVVLYDPGVLDLGLAGGRVVELVVDQAPSADAAATTISPAGYSSGPLTSSAGLPSNSGFSWATMTSSSSMMNRYHWPSRLSGVL